MASGAGAALWLLMMLAWLGGLLSGLWQAWPVFREPAPPQEVVAVVMWLVIGGAAWLLALNFGLRRFRRRS